MMRSMVKCVIIRAFLSANDRNEEPLEELLRCNLEFNTYSVKSTDRLEAIVGQLEERDVLTDNKYYLNYELFNNGGHCDVVPDLITARSFLSM